MTPLYTNYKDGWPLTPWEGCVRRGQLRPGGERQAGHGDRAVDRRARSVHQSTRCSTTSSRTADRGGPDDHELGGLEEQHRHRQDRHDGARLVGDRRRCRRPRRRPARTRRTSATCRSRPRSTASSTRWSAGLQERHQRPLQEQGGRPRLGRLVRRQVARSPTQDEARAADASRTRRRRRRRSRRTRTGVSSSS